MSAMPVLVHGVESCIDCSSPGRIVVHGDVWCPRRREYHAQHCTVCFRREVWTTSLVCHREFCRRTFFDRLAAKVIRTASSEEGSGPRLPGPSTFAAVTATHGALQAGDCGIFSTGPELGCSPSQVRPGPVDPSGSGSTRFPDERPSVAPLPHP